MNNNFDDVDMDLFFFLYFSYIVSEIEHIKNIFILYFDIIKSIKHVIFRNNSLNVL